MKRKVSLTFAAQEVEKKRQYRRMERVKEAIINTAVATWGFGWRCVLLQENGSANSFDYSFYLKKRQSSTRDLGSGDQKQQFLAVARQEELPAIIINTNGIFLDTVDIGPVNSLFCRKMETK